MNLPNFLVKEPTASVALESETIRLWPISTLLLLKFKSMAKPIIQAVSELLTSTNTVRTQEKTLRNGDDEFCTEETVDPINPDLLKVMSAKREARVDKVIDALLSEESYKLMLDVLVDSMRDFRGQQKDLRERLGEMDLPVLVDLLKGIAKANKEVFDPLLQMVPEGFVSRTKASFEHRLAMGEVGDVPTSETPSPTLLEDPPEAEPKTQAEPMEASGTPVMSSPAT